MPLRRLQHDDNKGKSRKWQNHPKVANRDRESGKMMVSSPQIAKMAKITRKMAKHSILTRKRYF